MRIFKMYISEGGKKPTGLLKMGELETAGSKKFRFKDMWKKSNPLDCSKALRIDEKGAEGHDDET